MFAGAGIFIFFFLTFLDLPSNFLFLLAAIISSFFLISSFSQFLSVVSRTFLHSEHITGNLAPRVLHNLCNCPQDSPVLLSEEGDGLASPARPACPPDPVDVP